MANRSAGLLQTGLLAVAALALTIEVSRQALAEHLETRRPAASAQLVADSGALGRLAEAQLRAGDARAALALTRRALAASPLDVRAMRVMAVALQRLGQSGPSASLLAFAGTRSWRDNELHARLVEAALRRQDLAAALVHTDVLLRRTIELREPMFAFLKQMPADPRAGEALVARLATRPPWREAFLYRLAREGEAEPGVTRVFQQLAVRTGLTDGEKGAFATRLVGQARFVEADRLALTLDKARQPGRVFDPAFEGRKGTLPFSWKPIKTSSAEIGSDSAPGGRPGSALRVEWDGRTSARLVRQLIVLKPGPYRLKAARFAEAGDPTRLSWRATCAETGGQIAATTSAPASLGSWRVDEAELVVPDACSAVWLILTATAPGSAGKTTAWFTDVTVAPAA